MIPYGKTLAIQSAFTGLNVANHYFASSFLPEPVNVSFLRVTIQGILYPFVAAPLYHTWRVLTADHPRLTSSTASKITGLALSALGGNLIALRLSTFFVGEEINRIDPTLISALTVSLSVVQYCAICMCEEIHYSLPSNNNVPQ